MKILAFAASLRAGSLNKKLVDAAAAYAREFGAEVDAADFREFDMPLYDGDLQARSGLPAGALELCRRIEAADGLLIAAPEYNFSLSGALKNAVDWVSRAQPMPLRGKSGLLLAASPSLAGGIRGLWQLRIPLEGCGVLLHPDMFALAKAHEAFDDAGALKEPALADRLRTLVGSYVAIGSAVASLKW